MASIGVGRNVVGGVGGDAEKFELAITENM